MPKMCDGCRKVRITSSYYPHMKNGIEQKFCDRCHFEELVKDGTMVKVAEGQYKPKPKYYSPKDIQQMVATFGRKKALRIVNGQSWGEQARLFREKVERDELVPTGGKAVHPRTGEKFDVMGWCGKPKGKPMAKARDQFASRRIGTDDASMKAHGSYSVVKVRRTDAFVKDLETVRAAWGGNDSSNIREAIRHQAEIIEDEAEQDKLAKPGGFARIEETGGSRKKKT